MIISIDFDLLYNNNNFEFQKIVVITDNERRNYVWVSIEELRELQISIKKILDVLYDNKIKIEEAKGGLSLE